MRRFGCLVYVQLGGHLVVERDDSVLSHLAWKRFGISQEERLHLAGERDVRKTLLPVPWFQMSIK